MPQSPEEIISYMCPECGEKLSIPKQSARTQKALQRDTLRCPNCRQEIVLLPPEQHARRKTSVAAERPVGRLASGRRKSVMAIAGFVLGVFCAAGAIFLLLPRVNDSGFGEEHAAADDVGAPDDRPTLTFGNRTWVLAGPCLDCGSFPPSMSAVYYTTDRENIRLIELVARESEVTCSRIIQVQANINGRWINHGPRHDWNPAGGRGEMTYTNGEIAGTQHRWYPNGQMHIEREWVRGVEHGRTRGWWPNGQQWFDHQYVNDVFVDGKNWDEEGRIR